MVGLFPTSSGYSSDHCWQFVLWFLPPANKVWGKVMFLHVCHSVHGVYDVTSCLWFFPRGVACGRSHGLGLGGGCGQPQGVCGLSQGLSRGGGVIQGCKADPHSRSRHTPLVGRYPSPGSRYTPTRQRPSRKSMGLDRKWHHKPPQPPKRAVRILLECCLVLLGRMSTVTLMQYSITAILLLVLSFPTDCSLFHHTQKHHINFSCVGFEKQRNFLTFQIKFC